MAAPRAAAVLATRGILELSGTDARAFLQGLVTADLGRLAPDRAIWAALLTAQGRCLAEFALVEDGPRILLDAEGAGLEALARRLALYKLRAAVTIEDRSAAWTVLTLPDPAAADRFGLPAERGACRRLDDALLFVDPRLAALGVRALVPTERLDAFLAAQALHPVDTAVWDRHRLALGVPEGAVDLPPEKALAVESGFLELDIVSLTKGCFVGQELTARMAHRGLVRRRLVPVRVEGPLPPPGAIVRLDGREVGEVRSGRDDRALALLRLEALGAGPLEADGARLRPELPGWMELG